MADHSRIIAPSIYGQILNNCRGASELPTPAGCWGDGAIEN